MKKNRLKRILSFLLVISLSVVTLAGCGSKSETSSQTSNDGGTTQESLATGVDITITPETEDHIDVLKVPNYDWVRIADSKGWFKEAFPDTEIQIVEGVSGKEIQLFDRGELYFANRMLYPTLLYAKAGADFKITGVSKHPESPIASIIVAADSPYQTFADLKGKKIGAWQASCPYMVLIELASQQGWTEGQDWTFVNVPSADLKNALLAGEIDAIANHASGDSAQLLVSGEAREIAEPAADSVYIQGGGVVIDFSPTSFVNEHPGIVKKYLELKEKTSEWLLANEDEAGELITSITRVPADVSKEWWNRSATTMFYSDLSLSEIKSDIKRTEDWLVTDGDILESERVNWDSYISTEFFTK